jgi:hypothetical protein
MNECSEEILEGYARQYRLDTELPSSYKKQALFLVISLRELKRMRFADRKEALRNHAKIARWLAEKQVFYRSTHLGYNELLEMVSASLISLLPLIDERFPE